MNAYLDTWVSFHCEGKGDVLIWQTNSVSLTDEIKETRNITTHPGITTPGIVNSTLLILAKPKNDGLNIGCIIGLHGSFLFDSAGADLFVKGNNIIERIIYFILLCMKVTVQHVYVIVYMLEMSPVMEEAGLCGYYLRPVGPRGIYIHIKL